MIFANDVANGCQGGGFVSFNVGAAGADYVAMIGNIAYDSIRGSSECYNGISIYQPVQSDAAAGTHIYVAGNFTWNNFQHNPCAGVQAWGGDGIIFDTFDGSQSGLSAYTAQAVADNNISIGNGGHGVEVQNNIAGSQHAKIYLRHNTSWDNEIDTGQQQNNLCAEMLINSGYNIQELDNLLVTNGAQECANNPVYALSAYNVDQTVSAVNNFAAGYNGQNTFAYATGGFTYASSNVLGQSTDFKGAYVPGAPVCSSTGDVANCMHYLVSGLTPESSAATGHGYQVPSPATNYDALFPQWLCTVNLPAALVTKGC